MSLFEDCSLTCIIEKNELVYGLVIKFPPQNQFQRLRVLMVGVFGRAGTVCNFLRPHSWSEAPVTSRPDANLFQAFVCFSVSNLVTWESNSYFLFWDYSQLSIGVFGICTATEC